MDAQKRGPPIAENETTTHRTHRSIEQKVAQALASQKVPMQSDVQSVQAQVDGHMDGPDGRHSHGHCHCIFILATHPEGT
jgi:hypothetical protein